VRGRWPRTTPRAAATSFQAALDARRDDPRALAELSWASFLAGDVAAAARAAKLATYCSQNPRLQAMAYYNLGRAKEALGAIADAEIAYAASLHLRDSPELRARLRRLAPALLAPHRIASPDRSPGPRTPARRGARSARAGAAPRRSLRRSATP